MNLLVTGGAGFIGSHFVLRHVERHPDDTVIVLDKLTYAGNKAFLDPVINRIRFVQGDIADVALVTQVLERYGINTVVNFAAETHVDRSIQNAVPFLHTNVLGVQALIEVLRQHPDVRLLHISTDEVYGDVEDGDRPRTVGDTLFPSSPYAASKAAGEMLLLAAMRTYKIKCAISRCTNNYGPHQALEKLIPTIVRHALKNEPIPVYAKGENKRDWLYVTDHCDALELILKTEWAFWDDQLPGVHPPPLEAPAVRPGGKAGAHRSLGEGGLKLRRVPHSGPDVSGGSHRRQPVELHESQPKGAGHLFNISADSEKRNIDVVKAVLAILGKPESLVSFVADRPGHDWRYAIDSSAIRKLGWKPEVTFEEGLKRTVEWYKVQLKQ